MFQRIVFTVLLSLLAMTQLVLAHELWIEQRDGKLALLYGHGAKLDPYDPQKVKEAKAFDAKGSPVPVVILREKESSSISSTGKPAIVTAYLDAGYWLKTTDGWKNLTKREADGKFSIVDSLKSEKYAKALLTPGDALSKPAGMVFEIVPEKDPFAVKPGEALPVKVLLHGKPVEGVVIKTGDAGHGTDGGIKTDKDGNANVAITKSGPQLINASCRTPLKDDPDADIQSFSTTLTFETK